MMHTRYVRLNEGDLVSPFCVLCTANDEPDYGFDLGLFEDNNTPFGAKYGLEFSLWRSQSGVWQSGTIPHGLLPRASDCILFWPFPEENHA